MTSSLPSIIGASIADVISALSLPGSNTLGSAIASALGAYQTRREEEARQILMREVITGGMTLADATMRDQLFAIWLRFRHAAVTGVAREKLRIMARILNGQLENRQLSPEAFSQLAGVIEGLRLEEIAFLVTLHELELEAPRDDKQRGESSAWIERELKARLIPTIFSNEEALEATEGAVMRTGLVIGPDAIVMESSQRRTSPLMAELVRIAKLQSPASGAEADTAQVS